MKERRIKILLLLCALSQSVSAAEGEHVIAAMEDLMWSNTNKGTFEMLIKTEYWQRNLRMDVWMDRPEKTFIRVLSPKKEKGIGSLRLGSEMWNYIPKIDRIIKIPPSMMLQPWMGSDFSNDDLVKESSLKTDYTHVVAAIDEKSGIAHIVSKPKPESAVVWGKIESWVYQKTGIPTRQLYFDESGAAVKEMTFSDIKTLGGRQIPTQWHMTKIGKEKQSTTTTIKQIEFDLPIDDSIFSERNLRSLDW
ncbi:MAG: outer membrane lipoprotein-sorting protein [Pseudomonadales bacterium]|nr:outer membrane lipoprotein-sorting protein [Pseudomonadales bacterium]